MTSLNRPDDELANLTTHGVALLVSLVAAAHLMFTVADRSSAIRFSCVVYSFSLILVYGASTLSHLFYDLSWRRRFRTLDQASIFMLIAGTYTPLSVKYLNHGWWPLILIAMWVLAFAGAIRVFQIGDLPRMDKALYGLLGILPAVTLGELFRQAPSAVVFWVVAGGAGYGLGAPFLRFSASRRFAHAIWHLFVVVGSACHYWAILLAVSDR